jgi:hypothetical protein
MNGKETKKDIQEPFFIVPSRIFELGLNPYELSVLLYLMMRADNKTHSCFPSEKGIAKACGMGRTTVSKSLCSLEEKNLIQKKHNYQQSKNGFMRQTSNNYKIIFLHDGASGTPTTTTSPRVILERSEGSCAEISICSPHGTGDTVSQHPPYHEPIPPIPSHDREINKTIPNITKNNISISTELSAEPESAVDEEKERFSFCELKRECFEALINEKGFDDDEIALLERALEHIWFKNGDAYEGKKYTQNELRELLGNKITPDLLACSIENLRASWTDVRSPVPYLAKCILGGLVNGIIKPKKAPHSVINDASKHHDNILDETNNMSSFDINDLFSAALKNTYSNDFNF